MAYRPDPSEFDKPLSRDELKELHRQMSLLSRYHLQEAYRHAYERCRLDSDVLPRAAALQELVASWKLLRSR